MSNKRRSTNKTSVKFLINFLVAALFFAPLAFAEGPAPSPTPSPTPVIPVAPNGSLDLIKALQVSNNPCIAVSGADSGPSSASCLSQVCGKLKDTASTAYDDLMKACGSGSLGGSPEECFKKAVTCDVVSKDEPLDTDAALNNAVNTILQGAGLTQAANLGTNKSGSTSKCPQYSGSDYKQRKKDLDDQIKDIKNKQIPDLQKDLAQQQKDTQKDIQDIQDDIQKSKKDADKDKADLDTNQRQQVADFNKNLNDSKNQMRQNSMGMLQLKGKLVESQRNQSMDLLKLNDSATKASCVKAAQEAYSKFQSAANTMSMTMKARSDQKQMVLNQYNDCLKTFDQARQQTIEKYRQEQQTITASIAQAQSEMDDMQHTMDLSQSQLTEMQQQNTDQKNKIDQDLIQQMQSAQNKMQAAQTNFTQQQQITNQKIAALQQDLTKATNDLNNLGPEPSSDATTSAKTASAIVAGKVQALDAYVAKCCQSGSVNCDAPSLQKASDAYHDAKGESRVRSSSPPATSTHGGS